MSCELRQSLRNDFDMIDIKGDGNCFFRAITRATYNGLVSDNNYEIVKKFINCIILIII